jgi:hypothetical protein
MYSRGEQKLFAKSCRAALLLFEAVARKKLSGSA